MVDKVLRDCSVTDSMNVYTYCLANDVSPGYGIYTVMDSLSSSTVVLWLRWAPPSPSSQSCSKTHVPSPVEDCGVPSTKARVGQYQGVCAFMAGWIHEATHSLDPHLSCTYVNTITQSQRIGILEVGSKTKVIEWCTYYSCVFSMRTACEE